MTTLDALRQAAAALLTTAPEPVVRRTLRQLLAGDNEAVDAIAPPAPHRRRGMRPAFPGKARTPPPDWSELRQQIRAAMRERGVFFDQVAERIGFARSTVQTAIGSTKPASPSLQAGLTDWLARAQASEAPFPFRGAAGNGADANAA